MTINKMAYIYK